jgi:Domain of Unknown Function (DUF1080)
MRLHTIGLIGIAAIALSGAARAQNNPFVGAWNITPEAPSTGVYWLEVKNEGGKPAVMFLNRGGSPVAGQDVKVSGDELTFMVGGTAQNRPTVTLRAAGNKVTGTVGTTKVAGERPPTWGACDANGSHALGKPVTLFDGKSLDAWGVQMANRPIGWSIEEGVMTNQPKANNLVSKEKFRDFRLDAEYKLSEKGNSGIYLRGRYELQVLDDFGRTDDREHGHMSIYSAKAPLVNASKKAGEWQTAQITIVGNCVSATLNGQKIHDNSKLVRITGGALDAKETEPGPIMVQGDHEKVWYRKVVVTPIASKQSSR